MSVLSAHLQVAFDWLASPPVIDYFKREKIDAKNLKKLMLSINNVIDDAEDKQTTNLAVKDWLDDLKDVVLDAEDVLDVIATQTLENEISPTATPPWNPFDRSLRQQLDDVIGRMQKLREEKDDLPLNPSTRSNSTSDTLRLPTTSLVEQYGVYGRDDDKDKIKNLLLSNDGKSNADVIAIVGMGGLGKTTLAQLAFNDHEIERVFQSNKVWIFVGEDFDVKRITKTILEKLTKESCHTDDFDELQMKLKKTLCAKMCLIVLDDVWNENYMLWDRLRMPFTYAEPGSKILVTARSESVASAMRATSTYKLEPLSDDACWLLFARHAIAENIPSNTTFEACWLLFEKHGFQKHAYSTFEALGKKVVNKCGGIPLASKVLGGLLGTRLGYEEWGEILTSSIWDLSKEVLPVLRLSYHYLPSNLKRCFAFCSIVSKDYDLERETLVLLWIAENLVQDSRGKRRIDVGYECLRYLESRSLIQPPSYTDDESYFSMHDLVNDLAKSVAGEFYNGLDNSSNLGEKTRHFSHVVDLTGFKRATKAKPLITPWATIPISLPPLFYSEIWVQLNLLRSLTLPNITIEKLPDSIENLKLLRYLDLSNNYEIKQLPESLANIYNLEVLKLRNCSSLSKLPSQMRKLIKLNHLDIRHTPDLQEMPLQMGRLKDLDVLTKFVVGKVSGLSIRELKELKYLRGELSIGRLQNITDPGDALEANLKEKSRLEELNLRWDRYPDNLEDGRIILDNLRPHVNLKNLYIYGYSGTRLPDWVGHYSFVNLVDIEVSNFEHCFDLSALGQLSSLKSLTIVGCGSLVTLVGTGIPLCTPMAALELRNDSRHPVKHFSALVKLRISMCPKLELPRHHCFTSIEVFNSYYSFASLQIFPLSLFPKLKNLSLSHFISLAVIDEANNINLDYLESIEIDYCSNFGYFNAEKWCAAKMTSLRLMGCKSLKALPENMCKLFPSLLNLKLTECPKLEALPQSRLPGNLTTLEIMRCNKLVANRSSWGLQRLLSLSTLKIGDFVGDDLISFPEEGLLPISLSTLWIESVPYLTNLNGKSIQLLTSLETLHLVDCPKLQCLPEEGLPTSLSSLIIKRCPLLETRCQREQGRDWSKIAHIPNIQVSKY